MSTDRYGRIVARVYRSGLDVNAEMVRLGGAWAFRRYLTDPAFLGIENEARAARRGLWALPEEQRLSPWEWRERQRRERAGAKAEAARRVPRRATWRLPSTTRRLALRVGAPSA